MSNSGFSLCSETLILSHSIIQNQVFEEFRKHFSASFSVPVSGEWETVAVGFSGGHAGGAVGLSLPFGERLWLKTQNRLAVTYFWSKKGSE
jgi:hypothetical protein